MSDNIREGIVAAMLATLPNEDAAYEEALAEDPADAALPFVERVEADRDRLWEDVKALAEQVADLSRRLKVRDA